MLLRRLTQHIKEQNWFAVGLDFFIVVIGVFIGIQVANWNDSLTKIKRETTYLRAVAADIHNDVLETDEITVVATSRVSALSLLIDKASNWQVPNGFASSRGQINVEQVTTFDQSSEYSIGIELFILSTLDDNRFAYETTINADGIGVIRNKILVGKIQEYYAQVDEIINFETSLEENRTRLIDAQQEVDILAIDLLSITEMAEQFSVNQPLHAAAKNYWLYANRHITLMSELHKEAENLIVMIDKELKQ